MGAGGPTLGSDPSRFDAILSQSPPFGDSAYIHGQMRGAYKRRVELIGERLPMGRRLLALLKGCDAEIEYRVLGDPVVRAIIQQALGKVVADSEMTLPLEQCEEVLAETVRHLETGAIRSPAEAAAVQTRRLGPSRTPWVWTVERADDPFGRAFAQLVQAEYGESLCTPSSADFAMLQKATELLCEMLPLLSRSALSHAHLVGVFPGTGKWEKVASSSQFRLTGVIFLNRTTFENPWWVAEHLLHESLHQKLYDFRHAHSLLARDDPSPSSLSEEVPKVVSLWNTPGLDESNCWDPHRVVAAFHVYVHLALFCTIAEQRQAELESVYGPAATPPAMTDSRRAFDRARYLGEKLRLSCWTELGLGGRWLVDWLCSVLDALDPCPSPPGSYLHLVVDRYLMEAAKIQKKPPSLTLARQLASVLEAEITSTEALLAAMGARAEASQLATALAKYPSLEHASAFPEIRRLIAETILLLAPNGHSLKVPSWPIARSPDECVLDMIETSSRELATIGAMK